MLLIHVSLLLQAILDNYVRTLHDTVTQIRSNLSLYEDQLQDHLDHLTEYLHRYNNIGSDLIMYVLTVQ